MAEPNDSHRTTPTRSEDTNDFRNPPASVTNRQVRKAALWSYVGPLAVLFLIVFVALLYWLNREPSREAATAAPDAQAIGTSGPRNDVQEGPNAGFNPAPRPGSTQDELEYRGVGEPSTRLPETDETATLRGFDALVAQGTSGRLVEVENAAVESVEDDGFWARHQDTRVKVVTPAGAPELRPGMRVNIAGRTESSGDTVQVRATNVTVAD